MLKYIGKIKLKQVKGSKTMDQGHSSSSEEEKEEIIKRWHRIGWGSVNTVLLFMIVGFIWASASPTYQMEVERSGEYLSPRTTFRFAFNRPVDRQMVALVEPAVAGNWTFDDFVVSPHLARTLVFTPETTLAPDTQYHVRITNVHNAFAPQVGSIDVDETFRTPPVPAVTSVTPTEHENVSPDLQWVLTLDRPNVGLADFEFLVDPAIPFTVVRSEDGMTYTAAPISRLDQGTTYLLTIFRRNVQYATGTETVAFQSEPAKVFEGEWQIRQPPKIVNVSPSGGSVKRTEKVSIQFAEPVSLDAFSAAARIEPELTGSWSASADETTFTYTSSRLSYETDYTVVVAAGTPTINAGYLEEEVRHTFTTIGHVNVTRFSPSDTATGVSVGNTIQVTFDQGVDHASAEKKFSVSPAIDGVFSWNGTTMIFDPVDRLAYDYAYTVRVGGGVQSVDGLDSDKEFSASFSTELSQKKLAVPFHRQERPLSCEAATLVMALRYRGVKVSESTLIDQIGYDPTPHKDGVWGNPHVAFVGSYYGKQVTTGYGVYWDPIARVSNLYRKSRAFTNGSVQDLTGEIQKGNPIIVWGNAASGKRADWKTTDGKNIVAIVGEHTRVVIGYVGSAENPTSIITLDPLSGERYFSRTSFEANWSLLGKAGVVVE